MWYVYVLRTEGSRDRFYLGVSGDLRERVAAHNAGRNRSTRGAVWRLVYYEAYVSRSVALRRERTLKHDGRSRRAVMDRVRASLEDEGRAAQGK